MTGGHITPDPTADRPLPVQRAFVLQLHTTAAVAQGQLSGRIEHVLSGQPSKAYPQGRHHLVPTGPVANLSERYIKRSLPLSSSTVTIKQHLKSRGHWLWASASPLEASCSWLHYLPGFTANRRVNLRYMRVSAPVT